MKGNTLKKLIFFTNADPNENLKPFITAYRFAAAAEEKGIKTEIRLAGPAVLAANPDVFPDNEVGNDIRTRMKAAKGGPGDFTF